MSDLEEIIDLNGKTYLSFNMEKEEEEKKIVGNKFEDFEILQKLGEGQFGKVFKVISKLNNKVYAMKMVNLEKLISSNNEKAYKLALNESKFLTDLSHPHIIKYYHNFTQGDYLYIIVENAENGDMKDFINAHRKSGTQIPEEGLWNIFLQCMKGLAYVHKMGVIHRDIKPGNILMDNNLTVKIGDFGVSAVKKNKEGENDDNPNVQYLNASYMQYGGTLVYTEGYKAKELEKKEKEKVEYDQKIDVYSMGVTFYELCHFHLPKKRGKESKVNYSKEMLDIINEMLEEDKDKRQTSEYFLDKIRKEISKKYNRNTSIDAIVRCLFTFEDLTNYYIQLKKNEIIQNKPMAEAFVECLENFTGEDMTFYLNSIKYFREILCIENTKFDKTKEIEPKSVLAFLIRKLVNEMNSDTLLENKMNNYYIKSGEEKARTSKEEMKIIFEKKFFTQLNSYIRQKMMGLAKHVFICDNCKIKTFSFSGYFFVTMDLEKILQYMNPSVENYFYFENKYYTKIEKYCIKCLMRTQHQKYKQYYTAPDYLIVTVQRGKNDSCRVPILLSQNIDLTNLIEMQGKKYKLVGFINKNYENDRYISFIEFYYDKKWYRCEGDKVNEYSPYDHTNMFNDSKGELIMAFYKAM